MALNDLLGNTSLADDTVIAVPDGKGGQISATLGEVRGMGQRERQTLAARASELEAARNGLFVRTQELQRAGLLDDQLRPVTNKQIKAAVEASGIDKNDPVFGEVYGKVQNELKGVLGEVAKLKEDIGKVSAITTQAMTGYLDDTYKAGFARAQASLPESLRNELTLDAVIDFAAKKKLTDPTGRLDIANAVDQLMWPKVKEHQLAEVNKSAEQLKADREALAAASRPGASNKFNVTSERDGFKPVNDKTGRVKSLDEVIAEAANDSKLWDSALNSAGI